MEDKNEHREPSEHREEETATPEIKVTGEAPIPKSGGGKNSNKIIVIAAIAAVAIIAIVLIIVLGGHKHSFGRWNVEKEATCTQSGERIRECDCGEIQYDVIPAKGHTEGKWVTEREATCASAGSRYQKCSVCEDKIRDEAVEPTGKHEYESKTTLQATCSKEGKTTYTCKVCANSYNETIAPNGDHNYVGRVTLEPTCVQKGTKTYTCSVCSDSYNEAIPTNDTHSYTPAVTTEATCISKGVKTYTCSGCGNKYTEQFDLPSYSASELYEQSVNYVGEIMTYDKNGNEYALGTGFVISSDGKIVTNYHVIEGAYSAKITINEKTYQIVQVLAFDKDIDLAVVKVNATNLTAAKVCKNNVKAGETVYAIGSSRGMTNTYSQGIITYADRVVDGVIHIQHDASITHGNSGGPLINVYGEVIGVNAWEISDSQNLNFAVSTKELDNLVYGTPLTMAEFYEQECSVFDRLVDYITTNGTYKTSSSGNYYRLVLGTTYSSDYSSKYTRVAYYYVDDNTVTLDLLIDDGDLWAYFRIDEDVDGSYFWRYFDDTYEMYGTLYANSYTSTTLLGYSYNDISSSSLRSTIRELASLMINMVCRYIDSDFDDIGVTAEDLGFYYY